MNKSDIKKIKQAYKLARAIKVKDICVCPSCGSTFVKTHYQQVFCKTKQGTECKDKYWNTVTQNKRNNTTRISPASKAFTKARRARYLDFDETHPFSEDAFMH